MSSDPLDAPLHPLDVAVRSLGVDTLLTMQIFASECRPFEKFQDELGDDNTLDNQSVHSDFSESSISAADLLQLV